MKGGTQTALALGVGYILGRRRKMRLTTMLAIGAATGGIGSVGGAAVKRGMKMLGSTEALGKVAPQLGEIADTVRGDLLDAGKAAAVAVATNRIGSLTDSLHEHAQRIREPAGAVADQAGAVTERAAGRIPRQRGHEAASDEDFETSRDEAAEPENGDEAETDEARGSGRRAAPARRRTARAGSVVTRTRTPAASRTRR
jgi:hypothetical protein